ncbi:long-chain fatty acid transport protein 6-like [Saccostrea echinata]|uniref:long-chain fatty acid transport protein 6-like n=1 Tax=Saccostrea echinata TaxID=191078 RepID=UPI002A82BDF1|nr:long-chain fatty acid transport protein 6-like [Saccostrea echinata]
MSKQQKAILIASGLVGTGYAAWKTWFPWIGDDIQTIQATLKALKKIGQHISQMRTVLDMFEDDVTRVPNKTFIIFEDRQYSYEFVDSMANKVANLAASWNLPRDTPVAMMIENEPAFVWTFIGLWKAGLIGALINYHLKAHPLIHSIKVSEAPVLIIGSGDDHLRSIEEILNDIPNIKIYVQGKRQIDLPSNLLSMDEVLLWTLPVPLCKVHREGTTMRSPILYIYTSGTTGLPKPAIVNNAKAVIASAYWQAFDYTENDIVYVVAPLYHSVSLALCLFNTIERGATIVLRRKFSARHYWEDVRKHKVTVIQYIGELCRYLLRVPENDLDGVHNVRMAVGNGLRIDIWEEFKTRFKIPRIVEIFGATEGSGALLNVTGKVGAVGRMSPFMKAVIFRNKNSQMHFIKFDNRTEEPIRDQNGKCIMIKPGEIGLVISGFNEEFYSGFYKGSKEMNEKKLIRNVFEKGDRWFSFGDLIYLDENYNVYFRDRTGDTFRWKGENVSTTEVADIISRIPFICDVNVFGVSIPGEDGRAGMAAIILKENQITADKLRTIYSVCEKELPVYARPLFLRFMPEFIVTQTMKNRKVELVEEGYDMEKVKDPLYFIDTKNKTYSLLTLENYQGALSSKL